MARKIGKYLSVNMMPFHKRKTSIWELWDNQEHTLGHIKWYSPWRQYCFFPVTDTVFNKQCLSDIEYFLEEKNNEKKDNQWVRK